MIIWFWWRLDVVLNWNEWWVFECGNLIIEERNNERKNKQIKSKICTSFILFLIPTILSISTNSCLIYFNTINIHVPSTASLKSLETAFFNNLYYFRLVLKSKPTLNIKLKSSLGTNQCSKFWIFILNKQSSRFIS